MVYSAIKSILGSGYNVCPVLIPNSRGAKWISCTMISNYPQNTKDGASTFDWYRFQIDCFTRTAEETDTLAAAVRVLLDNYSGTKESVIIDRIYFDGEHDMVESIEEFEGRETMGAREDYFRRSQDYIIAVKT